MRAGFVTCVELGLSCMEEIYGVGGRLDLAVTLPDDKARQKSGRVYLDAFCQDREIPLVKSPHVNDALVLDSIREAEIDWLFIIGWSQIAREELLSSPRKGALGMHPTLLPEGRGRASIPWAIIKGLRRTGVTLFKLDEGVDTGPVLAQEVISLADNERATELYERVKEAHRSLISRVWPDLEVDRLSPMIQDERYATVWPARRPEDGLISPDEMTTTEIDRLVRAVTHPYPGAFIDAGEKRLRVWAGYIGRPCEEARADAVRIVARDGTFFATEFEWVPI